MIAKMSAKTADILMGTPPDGMDSPLFHTKILAAHTAPPTRACLAGIETLLGEVEAEFAATDRLIAVTAASMQAALADIADPSQYVLDGHPS